ncbi:hypothetical protein HZ989_04060 [Brevundimonas sp. AJA228-03]|uniref:hypothetical protein n=1 Tax=Brevundimonas sp. AJA228-03 TaxID=2752515 RepID=UPI001ADF935E|nr:hypothetical protein [Brevundimonas sp. AJA228-03]QTN20252.1 hypothetical protein HZ989_04060 [Brevundimonas sp. AJA228-03]
MAVHKDKTLSGPVDLDAGVFENIVFENAQLFYSGGTPPQFVNCAFNTVAFELRGPAHRTLGFLRSMAPEETGMREVFYGLVPEIKP